MIRRRRKKDFLGQKGFYIAKLNYYSFLKYFRTSVTYLISLRLGCAQHIRECPAQCPSGAHEVVALRAAVIHEGGQHLDLPGHVGQVGGDGVDGCSHCVVVRVVPLAGQGYLIAKKGFLELNILFTFYSRTCY